MYKKILFLFIVFLFFQQAFSHEKSRKVIIDTDAAPDDMRAICMLLARNDINVLAITTSDGALDPKLGANKVQSLLHSLGKENIPIGVGLTISDEHPPFRSFSESFYWGNNKGEKEHPEVRADMLLEKVLSENKEVSLLCLGPLTNISPIIEIIKSREDIELIWYSDYRPKAKEYGFNYVRDTSSAGIVLHANVGLKLISNLRKKDAMFDESMLESICAIGSDYSHLICNSFKRIEDIDSKMEEGHFKLWDDLVVVYYLYPQYFKTSFLYDTLIQIVEDYNICKVREAIERTYRVDNYEGILFKEIPHQPGEFRPDISPYVEEIIKKHGEEEWRACLLTNEIHGHLGIYSLIGAKMGIRAREYFDVGIDQLYVLSSAGSKPPISCLNDGLQVSTGATLGQGTIQIKDIEEPKPEAVFTLGEKSIKIVIKHEYLKKFKSDIENALLKHDLSDEGYWQMIRELAIRYWLELDRNEIFIVEELIN